MSRWMTRLSVVAILAMGAYAVLHSGALCRSQERARRGGSQVAGATAPVAGQPGLSAAVNPASWGSRIAAGHAFAKHGHEFGFHLPAEMAAHIDRVIASPSATRHLSRGREAYWDDGTGSVVICDPGSADGGTTFKPDRGRAYYEGLR